MRALIAVVTCEKRKARADAQRETWVPRIKGVDVRFFLAKQAREPLPDEVFLDVPDDYENLPLKVRTVFQWAQAEGYSRVLKTDDDVYMFPEVVDRIPTAEYAGHVNWTPPRWCSGFAYWLGSKALQIIAEASLTEDSSEDRWVASVMNLNGIAPENILGFQIADCIPRAQCVGPDTLVACEFDEAEMRQVHNPPGGWRARKARIDRSRARIMRGDGTQFI